MVYFKNTRQEWVPCSVVQFARLGVCMLQLKLRRVAKPQVRDKDLGAWLCYHATGGAVTVLCKGCAACEKRGPNKEQPLNF